MVFDEAHFRSGEVFQMAFDKEFRLRDVSELSKAFRKNRDKLFTFLAHDGVPWNNNNAEHAVKGFAYYREVADNLISGAERSLPLLHLVEMLYQPRP